MNEKQNISKHLLKGTLLTSLVAIITILSFMGIVYFEQEKELRKLIAQEQATLISHLLEERSKDILFEMDAGLYSRLRNFTEQDLITLDILSRKYQAEFPILKIKIFKPDTEIVYSTDKKIIGQFSPHNSELEEALEGETSSKWEFKDSLRDLDEEEKFDVQTIETYVPIKNDADEIVGSYEIYLDYTRYYDDLKDSTTEILLKLGVLLIGLFSIICGIVAFASRLITKNQNLLLTEKEELGKVLKILDERKEQLKIINEGLEHKVAERTEELRKEKGLLEIKVQERTEELKTSNRILEEKVAKRTKDLSDAKELLEIKVEERTKELNEKMADLVEMNRLMTGRELKMIELKKEVNSLYKELGKAEPYDF